MLATSRRAGKAEARKAPLAAAHRAAAAPRINRSHLRPGGSAARSAREDAGVCLCLLAAGPGPRVSPAREASGVPEGWGTPRPVAGPGTATGLREVRRQSSSGRGRRRLSLVSSPRSSGWSLLRRTWSEGGDGSVVRYSTAQPHTHSRAVGINAVFTPVWARHDTAIQVWPV